MIALFYVKGQQLINLTYGRYIGIRIVPFMAWTKSFYLSDKVPIYKHETLNFKVTTKPKISQEGIKTRYLIC